jgi:SAM-dependent methyltransferase
MPLRPATEGATTPALIEGCGPPKIFTPEYYARMRRLEAESWWNAGMRDIALRLLRSLSLPREGRLLDAGCGSGQTMRWLADALPSWNRAGIDVSYDAVRSAAELGENVTQASVMEVPFADASFDLVVSLDVLQHLPLPDGDVTALRELRRTAVKGGVLLLRTNAQCFPRVAEDRANMYRRYDPRTLRGVLRDAGFEVLRLGRANSLLGVAEIPRELRARKNRTGTYYGLLSQPKPSGAFDTLKFRILQIEGNLIARGWTLPFGRTLFALCRVST